MKIALGVSGGIAAYKAAELTRLLQQEGLRVQVVMTEHAQEFVRPLTFAALTGEKVITSLFDGGDEPAGAASSVEHIALARTIDALVVVPATANIIAKMASGVADDFLTTLYLATQAPVLIAPANEGLRPKHGRPPPPWSFGEVRLAYRPAPAKKRCWSQRRNRPRAV